MPRSGVPRDARFAVHSAWPHAHAVLSDAVPRSTSAASTVFAEHHSVHGPALTRSLHPHAALMHWWAGAGGGSIEALMPPLLPSKGRQLQRAAGVGGLARRYPAA